METHYTTKKDYGISLIRMLSMFMIITCHVLQYYDNVFFRLFNVGVQVFLIISGYLYGIRKIESVPTFLFKQVKKIIVPYWTFLIVAVALYWILSPDYISPVIVRDSFLTIGTIRGLGHLWFIKYILVCYCLLPLLNAIRDRMNSGISMFVAGVFTMILVHLFFTRFDVLEGDIINCFVLGYFLSNIEKRFDNSSLGYLTFSVIVLALVMNLVKFDMLCKDLSAFDWNGGFSKYSHLLLGAAIFLLLYKYATIEKNKILDMSDKYSYTIYVVHQIFIWSPLSVMSLSGIQTIDIALVYILSCIGGYLLYLLSNYISR